MPTEVKNLGKRIDEQLNKKNWSQRKLAKESGVSTSTVNRIVHGKETTIGKIEKIANALGVEIGELIG